MNIINVAGDTSKMTAKSIYKWNFCFKEINFVVIILELVLRPLFGVMIKKVFNIIIRPELFEDMTSRIVPFILCDF